MSDLDVVQGSYEVKIGSAPSMEVQLRTALARASQQRELLIDLSDRMINSGHGEAKGSDAPEPYIPLLDLPSAINSILETNEKFIRIINERLF